MTIQKKKELISSQIHQSEEDCQKATAAIRNFINHFTVENSDVLYCLCSGGPVPNDVCEDLISAEKTGDNAYKEFVKERLVEKSKELMIQ